MNNLNEHTIDSAQPKAGKKEWIGLAVIALPCLLYSMDLTVLNLALPHLSADLHPGSAQLLWIIDIYGFMVAGFLITMGTLGDRIGRRKLLLIGATAFGVASIFAAFANSAEMLIAARAILGIAGATIAPSTLSLIRNMFQNDKERTTAIGIWIISYSIGGAVGPLVGGLMLEHFWWGSVFLLAVPVMLLLLAVGPALLPEYRDPDAGRIDLPSALMSLVAVLSIIFGLKQIAADGFGWQPVMFIVVGVLIATLFVSRQKKLANPLIDLSLFRRPKLSASLLIYTFSTFVAFGTFVFFYLYMQLVMGFSPIKAGLWSLPTFVAFVAGSMLAPVLVKRSHPFTIIAVGMLIAVIGFGMLTLVKEPNGFWFLLTGAFVYCLGISPVFTLTTDIIVGSAPPEKAGAASALSETGAEFGAALGIAIMGSLGTFIYRDQLSANMPEAVPPGIAAAAKETLTEAVVQSRSPELTPELSSALTDAAHNAFLSGMQAAAILCALVALGLCIISLKQSRRMQAAT